MRNPAVNMQKATEAELIFQAQQGNKQAFGKLVHCYREGVVNVVYRMCGDINQAEDAAQVAFIRAWQKLSQFKAQTSFRNWIYRIAINATLDQLRRDKHYSNDLEKYELEDKQDSPETMIENKERDELVKKAILSLPEASRAALILREFEQLSYKEISEVLDIPSGTVMSRLNYGHKRLLELLKPHLEVK